MTEPYYEDDSVQLFLGDCLEIDDWLAADVLVTDPPYGMAHISGWDSRGRAIRNDQCVSTRDQALALWGPKPAAVFGTWKEARPLTTRHLLIWDKSLGTGCGMGDLDVTWGNSHEEIYILGEWVRGARPRHPSVIRTSDGMRSLSGKTGHPTPKPLPLMERLIDHCPPRHHRGPVRRLRLHPRRRQGARPQGHRGRAGRALLRDRRPAPRARRPRLRKCLMTDRPPLPARLFDLIVSWHTRTSGTYRLFDVLIGNRHGTYADALRYAKGEQ